MCQVGCWVIKDTNIVFLSPLLIEEAIEYFLLGLKICESEYR